MKPEFKAGRGKIEVDAPRPKKQAVPSKGYIKKGKGVNSTDAKPFNDISWYNKYPALFEDAATVGFNHIKGTTYVDGFYDSSNKATFPRLQDGNVLNVEYITSPGVVLDSTSGYEMQIRRLYLAMKRKYRGLNTYQVPDLGVTLFCVGEFYRLIAKLERIYGICNYYNASNRIMPKSIPIALRFDLQDLMLHLADFRAGINALIARAHSLCLPNGLDFVNRWFLLESNIFKDSEGSRSGYIVFDDVNQFYTYQPTIHSGGGAAVLCYISRAFGALNAAKYNELLTAANDVLNLLLNDDDVTLQLGDIVSYFTKDNGDTDLMVLTPLPDDYVVTPVYNRDILLQVHNSNTIGKKFSTYTSGTITTANFDAGDHVTLSLITTATCYTGLWQGSGSMAFDMYLGNSNLSNNALFYDQSASGAQGELQFRPGNLLIDTWVDKPAPADVMEMTRLSTAIRVTPYVVSSAYYHSVTVEACGTELVEVYAVIPSDATSWNDVVAVSTVLDSTSTTAVQQMAYMSKFDWHPLFVKISGFDTSTTMGSSWTFMPWIFGDLDNAKVITPNILVRLHDAAIMSLFDVQSIKALLPEGK